MKKNKDISKLFHFCLVSIFLIITFLLYYTSWSGITYLFASPALYIIPVVMAVLLWSLKEGVVALFLALLAVAPLFFYKIQTGEVRESIIILSEVTLLLLVGIFFIEFIKKRIKEITKSGGIETITQITVDKEKEAEKLLKSIRNLHQIALSSVSIKEEDFKFILEDIIDYFKSRCCVILLKDEPTEDFYFKYFAGDTKEAEKIFKSNLGKDMKSFIIKTSGHIMIGDICEDIRYRSFSQALVRSILCVPMILYGNIIALMYVDSPVKDTYQEKDVEVLSLYGELLTLFFKAEHLQDKLEEVSIYDETSDLMSLSYFQQRLDEEVSRVDRYGAKLVLVLASIKIVTEKEMPSFITDDLLLKDLAKIFLKCVRQGDILARYKSSSFAVALIDSSTNLAFIFAERVQKSILEYLNDKNLSKKNSVNIGIGKYKTGLNKKEFLRKLEEITEKAHLEEGNISVLE
ncbi:diguanylate cyclase [bacterium]|nr:diguanylate cyclase [bacterium]